MIVFDIDEHRFGIKATLLSVLYASLSFDTFVSFFYPVKVKSTFTLFYQLLAYI